MKFFWKIFFVFTALITMVFSLFGIWMITQTFRNSMEKEIEEGDRENRMFQFAFETNMNSLSDNYRTEKIVVDLVKSVVGNLDDQGYVYKLYRGGDDLIYASREIVLEHGLTQLIGDNTCIYQVAEDDKSRYLIFMSKSTFGGITYYLESYKDISSLYAEREGFYAQYRVIMLGLIAASGLAVLLLSHFLTRSVAELSYTTRRFARGDYDVRSEVTSEDEIGRLARDFNIMADSLNQKMEELTEAARKQEDFTASFAHELKTPLTSVIGYADMLRTMDMSKEESMEAANYIYSQGKRLESLSLKLLELIVTRNQEYQFKQLSTKELAEEVEKIISAGLKQKQIVMEMAVEEGTVYGEPDLLLSLLTNLLDNARKALPEGGHISLQGKNEKSGYAFSVADNGCGIPQAELDKITEAFYMVDKSRSRKEGGAGLGMTLCARIVEVHHAKWYIQSKEGEGTKVTVVLPVKEVRSGK